MATTMVAVKRRLVVLGMALAVALAGTGVVAENAAASYWCSKHSTPQNPCKLK